MHEIKTHDEWWRRSVLRQFGKQPRPKMSLSSIVEGIISGRDFEPEGMMLVLAEGWERQMTDWEDAAQRQGDRKRQEELEALYSFFSLIHNLPLEQPEDLLTKVEGVRRLVSKPDSPTMQSGVLGSLGATLSAHGFAEASFQLTQEALAAARRGGLKWAELQWAMNLALSRVNNAPQESDRELRRLLLMARNLRDHRKIGIILNNLAFVNERFLSNLIDAIGFQEEAVAIAHAASDTVGELKRVFHLAQMQEQVGQVQAAIENYDRGLALDAEVGISEVGFQVFRHATQLIANQYHDKTKEILASHVRTSQAPHSLEDIRRMLEESEKGMMMSSWDPSLGSVYFKPEHSFASELSVRQEWQALAVYAYQWMDQGFLTGDNRGFHWLSVALRSLGYVGTADWALTVAMDLPKAFGKSYKPEDRGSSR